MFELGIMAVTGFTLLLLLVVPFISREAGHQRMRAIAFHGSGRKRSSE